MQLCRVVSTVRCESSSLCLPHEEVEPEAGPEASQERRQQVVKADIEQHHQNEILGQSVGKEQWNVTESLNLTP